MHTHIKGVCFECLYKRNMMIERETGNWAWWGASAKCVTLIKVTNIITMCYLTFLNPHIRNPLSSCTSLSRLTSCSVNHTQETLFSHTVQEVYKVHTELF